MERENECNSESEQACLPASWQSSKQPRYQPKVTRTPTAYSEPHSCKWNGACMKAWLGWQAGPALSNVSYGTGTPEGGKGRKEKKQRGEKNGSLKKNKSNLIGCGSPNMHLGVGGWPRTGQPGISYSSSFSSKVCCPSYRIVGCRCQRYWMIAT